MTVSQRMLVVVFPDWPLTALAWRSSQATRIDNPVGDNPVRDNPVGELVAVVEGQRVVACSPAASAQGVVRGQHRGEAQSLCLSLLLHQRDCAVESRAFEPVIEALEHFTPDIVTKSPGWIGMLTRGPARYFGGESRLFSAVDTALRESFAGFAGAVSWQIGIADGAFAATLAASVGCVVPEGETVSFLSTHPVAVLGNPGLADLLVRLGINTVGEFAALDEISVSSRFGLDGLQAHGLARGGSSQESAPERPSREFSVETPLDPPTDRIDSVLSVVRLLAEELCGRLADEGLGCSMIEIAVGLSDARCLTRLWSHDGPWSALFIAERLRWQIESWLIARPEVDQTEPPGGMGFAMTGSADGTVGIVSIRLEAREITPDKGAQLELWGRPRVDDERLARACARIQGMLGTEAVLQPRLVGGRGPVEQVRLVPFGDPLPVGTSLPLSPWPGRIPAPSPALVGNDPERVALLDGNERSVGVDARGVVSGSPDWYEDASGRRTEVICWAGPWPVDERWWDQRARRRRARLQVITGTGEALLLVLDRGNWSVEGRYD